MNNRLLFNLIRKALFPDITLEEMFVLMGSNKEIKVQAMQFIKQTVATLKEQNVRLIRLTADDSDVKILNRTIQELQREKDCLLKEGNKAFLALGIEKQQELKNIQVDCIENIIMLDKIIWNANKHALKGTCAKVELPYHDLFGNSSISSEAVDVTINFNNRGLTRMTMLHLVFDKYKNATVNIHLKDNCIAYLPSIIYKLNTLDVRGNNLTTLPEALGDASKLESLLLEGNPLVSLPKSVETLLKQTGNDKYLELIEKPSVKAPQSSTSSSTPAQVNTTIDDSNLKSDNQTKNDNVAPTFTPQRKQRNSADREINLQSSSIDTGPVSSNTRKRKKSITP